MIFFLQPIMRPPIGTLASAGPLPYGDVAVFLPLHVPRNQLARIVARLKSGITLGTARYEGEAIARRLSAANPPPGRDFVVTVSSLKDHVLGDSALTVRLIFVAALLVLLITCANVARLILARSTARAREIAVRLALGASRAVLVRGLLLETLLICSAASVVGLLLSTGAVRLLIASVPYYVPRLGDAHTSAAVFAFTLGIIVFASIAFAVSPLLEARDLDLNCALKEGSRQFAGSARQRWLRSALVVTEIAVACIVLVVAGLLVETFLILRPSHPGFTPHQKLTLRIGRPRSADREAIALVNELQTLLCPAFTASPP